MDEKPPFEETTPVESKKPPYSETMPVTEPTTGGGEALGEGFLKGVSANFREEIGAASKASGLPEVLGGFRAPVGAAKLGYEYLTDQQKSKEGEPPTTTEQYEKHKKEFADRAALLQKEHPVLFGTGEIGGAATTMGMLPGVGLVKGAGVVPNIARGAIVGGEYGTLSGAGAGEGLEGRATSAATEGAVGTVGGAAIPAAFSVVGIAGKPVLSTIRGWINSEAEAGTRLAGALAKDAVDIASGKVKGLSLAEWQAAKARGEPVTLADLGAGNTQAFLRSSANTSPEGRAIIEKVVNERFEGQGDRVSKDIRDLVSGGANAGKTRDQLIADYDLARVPAYKKAFAQPNAQAMWNGDFEQISQAPVVQEAIRGAMVNARNEAAKMGLTPPSNPFVKDANGRFVLDPNSGLSPTLQFWDVVKKNLDNIGSREGQFWSKQLRSHLDNLVPEYGEARGIAAKFFGERDALDAGRTAAGRRMPPDELSKVFRSMNPEEKDLFREGWAEAWSNKVMEIRDRADVTGRIFESPNERARAAVVFGAQNLGKIEARINLEKIFDGARKALGNSTTVRQMIESGLAGGAIGGYYGDWNPGAIVAGGLAGTGIGAGASHFAGAQITSGAQKVIGYVDRGTAKKVAELLVSDDPQKLAQGLQIAARNSRIAQGLNAIARNLGVASIQSQKVGPMVNKLLPKTGAVPAAAEPEQNKRYGGRANKPNHGAKNNPPIHGARRAPDGKWYVSDPKRHGRFLRVDL